jgi:SAM-dependent methyltransferase
MSFNPDLYSSVRPPYPEALFVAIGEVLVQVDGTPKLLEIGAGDGLATAPMLELGQPEIHAVEPNPVFVDNLRLRFGKRLRILPQAFEAVSWPKKCYDAVYAANSFHWLDAGKRFELCHKLLKEEGWLVLFWNYYLLDSIELFTEVQKVYSSYAAPVLAYAVSQYKKMAHRRLMIDDSQFFDLKEERRFLEHFVYTSDRYINLLRTFPDHSHYPDAFFLEVKNVIETFGGEVLVQVPSQLLLAKKRN